MVGENEKKKITWAVNKIRRHFQGKYILKHKPIQYRNRVFFQNLQNKMKGQNKFVILNLINEQMI